MWYHPTGITIVAGGLAGNLVGPYVQHFMTWIGSAVNMATELSPIPMGIIVAVIVGMVLTLPISSAALCIMLNLSGLAAGAATVGCCAQMIGFAVASYKDNGISRGCLSQGLGTSMLQVPNIMRRPQIWIAPTLAAAFLRTAFNGRIPYEKRSSRSGNGDKRTRRAGNYLCNNDRGKHPERVAAENPAAALSGTGTSYACV